MSTRLSQLHVPTGITTVNTDGLGPFTYLRVEATVTDACVIIFRRSGAPASNAITIPQSEIVDIGPLDKVYTGITVIRTGGTTPFDALMW